MGQLEGIQALYKHMGNIRLSNADLTEKFLWSVHGSIFCQNFCHKVCSLAELAFSNFALNRNL
jgi:hypothetical protein